MSKSDAWMPLHIGAYLADTGDLSTIEHGAYMLLLMQHWTRGDLPDDDAKLARIAKLRLDHWKKIAPTIRSYFGPGEQPGTLRQKRLQKERVKARDLSDKRAAAARYRWETEEATPGGLATTDLTAKPLNPNGSGDAIASDLDDGCKLHKPLPSPTESKEEATLPLMSDCDANASKVKPSSKRKPGNGEPDGFADWYDIYPRHEKRAAAARAFPNASKKAGGVEKLIAFTKAYRFSANPQYVPHPSTWLNDERWTDATDPFSRAPGTVLPFPRDGRSNAKPRPLDSWLDEYRQEGRQ